MKTPSSIRRSPVHGSLEELNPMWAEVHGMKVPLRFKDTVGETHLKTELSLCDLSCLPKISVKGPESMAWLTQTRIRLPERVYEHCSLEDGSLVIRTDRQEIFLEGS